MRTLPVVGGAWWWPEVVQGAQEAQGPSRAGPRSHGVVGARGRDALVRGPEPRCARPLRVSHSPFCSGRSALARLLPLRFFPRGEWGLDGAGTRVAQTRGAGHRCGWVGVSGGVGSRSRASRAVPDGARLREAQPSWGRRARARWRRGGGRGRSHAPSVAPRPF